MYWQKPVHLKFILKPSKEIVKMIQRNIQLLIMLFLVAGSVFYSGCRQAGGDFPGREYMMDMGHPISYQANTSNYYYFNTWGTKEEYYAMVQPRLPVQGTVSRGYTGIHYAMDSIDRQRVLDMFNGNLGVNAIVTPVNTKVPFYYDNTEEGRELAMAEIVDNPFPITEKGLASGKKLYEIFCGVCHGNAGDGLGVIYENGAYPAAPANFLSEEFIGASNGRYYYSIMHGRGVMGAYSDKLNYEERWNVIHYIRSLQAKELGVPYSVEASGGMSVPAAETTENGLSDAAL